MRSKLGLGAVTVTVMLASIATAVQAGGFSGWSTPQKIDEIGGNSSELNTPYLDGCPIQSPDGLSLYMASNRPRFAGDTRTDLDIWVAHRASKHAPFGSPVNLGPPVNSTADDFCPTPIPGDGLFFVSRKSTAESCGLGDIYFTRRQGPHGWREPEHLACAPDGPNSHLDEQGPSFVTAGSGPHLYFSRSAMGVPGDIFVSQRGHDGFGPAAPVSELNDAAANDIQPNVSKNGREVVFSSNRVGSVGSQDIWISTRASTKDPWSAPVNVGVVNTSASESRPSLSRDALQLLFGRTPGPEGMSDIYVTTRERLPHHKGDD